MPFVNILAAIIIAFFAMGKVPVDDAQRARLTAVANDIWEVSGDKPLFKGIAAREATALVLTAVAAHESGFEQGVEDCSACPIGGKRCDGGRSISLYQLHNGSNIWGKYTREEICASNKLAATRALWALHRTVKSGTTAGMFMGYAGKGNEVHGMEIESQFRHFIQKQGILIGWKDGGTQAWFAKKSVDTAHAAQ